MFLTFSKIKPVGQKHRDKTTLASKTRFSLHCLGFQSRHFSLLVGYNIYPSATAQRTVKKNSGTQWLLTISKKKKHHRIEHSLLLHLEITHCACNPRIGQQSLSITLELKLSFTTEEATGSEQLQDKPCGLGWAQQKPRGGGARFSENVKSYLTANFDFGEDTGRKADPTQVGETCGSQETLMENVSFKGVNGCRRADCKGFFHGLQPAKGG